MNIGHFELMILISPIIPIFHYSNLPLEFTVQRVIVILSLGFPIGLLLETGKDHPPCGSLEDAGDDDISRLSHLSPSIVDHNHCPVIQVGNPLSNFFSLFEDFDIALL